MRLFHLIRETFQFVMQNLFTITIVTLAWLVLLLPVITAPGATVAVYYFARQAVLQDEALFRDFVEGLKRFFWKGWLLVLPYAALLFVLVYDIAFFLAQPRPSTRLWASVPMAAFSLLLVIQNYVFVFFVKENGALWSSIRKSFLLAVSNGFFSLGLLVFVLVYSLALYATRIGLAILLVGPLAVLQSKAVQQLLAGHRLEF